MDYLGLPYKLWKQQIRFKRSENARKLGMDHHYAVPLEEISANHTNVLHQSEDISNLLKNYQVE